MSNLGARLKSRSSRSYSGCLEWIGTPAGKMGYGQIRVGGVTMMAHRVSWEEAYGPIPDGMIVCHKCDNPRCIEPTHLFLGTYKDNRDDAVAKGRLNVTGSNNNRAKLNEEMIPKIRRLLSRGFTTASIARRYSVSDFAIYSIKIGRTWTHVPDYRD